MSYKLRSLASRSVALVGLSIFATAYASLSQAHDQCRTCEDQLAATQSDPRYPAYARRFWEAMRGRLEEFSLSLHPEKTRLIEFGRFAATNRKRRGLGKPETFNFWASPSSAAATAGASSFFAGKPGATGCERSSWI